MMFFKQERNNIVIIILKMRWPRRRTKPTDVFYKYFTIKYQADN
jgi:hypothetical protein